LISASSLPQRDYLFAIFTLEGEGEFKKSAVKRGSVVLCEFDQPGFDDQPTKLDKMPGWYGIGRLSCVNRHELAIAQRAREKRLRDMASVAAKTDEASKRRKCSAASIGRRPD
jgi:hypothetical protein